MIGEPLAARGDSLRDSLGDSTRSNLWVNLWHSLRNNLWAIRDNLGAILWDSTRSPHDR